MKKQCYQQGFSLVEVLIAIALLGIGGTSIVMMLGNSYQSSQAGSDRSEATFLASQTYEAVRSIGQNAYNRLIDGTYGLDDSIGTWNLSATSDTVDRFTRQVVVETAQRDTGGDLVSSGMPDIHTKKITTTINWDYLGVAKVSQAISYFTNWDSLDFFNDSDSDFSAGVHSNTQTLLNEDGELALAEQDANPSYDFACASPVGVIDLGVLGYDPDTAYDVFLAEEVAYVISDDDDADGTYFSTWNVADPANPVLLDSEEISDNREGVRVVVADGYAYVGMATGSEEIRIFNVQNPNAISAHATLNIPGNGDILDMHLDADGHRLIISTIYNSSDFEIAIYDISTPGSLTQLGGVDLWYDIPAVWAQGDYLYGISHVSSNAILGVFNIANPSMIVLTDTINLGNPRAPIDVVVSGDYTYVSRDGHDNRDELHVVNTSDPSDLSEVESYDLTGENNTQIYDLSIESSSNRLFISYEENGDTEGRIYDVSNPLDMTLVNQYEFGRDARGVHVEGDLAAFATDGPDGSGGEVRLIQAQSCGGGSGVFLQDDATQGLLSLEAENYHANTAQGGDNWNEYTSPSGYSGQGFLRAEPDNGTTRNADYVANAPRLDFSVNFVKTGTHYVWIRGYKEGGSDDSVHVGLDGVAVSSADRLSNFDDDDQWEWSSTTMDGGSRATINIDSAGEHEINVWMREDGFRLDKIVLTTDDDYEPGGEGPNQSEQSASGGEGSAQFIDDDQTDFDAGTYSQTIWETDHVELADTQSSGTFTSQVFDSGETGTAWDQIAWTEILNQGTFKMEVGTVMAGNSFTTVNLDQTYTNPVVIPFYHEDNNSGPVSVRVNDLDSDSFALRLQASGGSANSDVVHYLVIEEGQHTFPDGTKIEAHTIDTDEVSRRGDWNNVVNQSYAHSFSSDPVVLHAVQTYNDDDWIESWVSRQGSSGNPPNTSGFQISLNGAEAATSHNTETIGWVAIERGSGTILGINYDAQRTSDSVQGHDNGCYSFNFSVNLTSTVRVIGKQQEMDGSDGSWAVGCSLSSTAIGLHAEEDQERDSERSHTHETMGFLAFENSFSYAEDSDLTLQVRSCNDAACSGETFVGPDGTGGTVFTAPVGEALVVSPNQYFQYQATFSGLDLTSELSSVTLDYTTPDQGGGGGYPLFGTYVSQITDAGSSANWNTIEWSEDLVTCPSSDIQVQIRTAPTAIALESALWQGPEGEDADETDFYTHPAGELIHTDHNGDEYMQYKVTLSGPGTCSPYLEDILITYTPY